MDNNNHYLSSPYLFWSKQYTFQLENIPCCKIYHFLRKWIFLFASTVDCLQDAGDMDCFAEVVEQVSCIRDRCGVGARYRLQPRFLGYTGRQLAAAVWCMVRAKRSREQDVRHVVPREAHILDEYVARGPAIQTHAHNAHPGRKPVVT